MASFDATSSAVPDSLLLARQADRLARQATNTVMQDTISRPALGDSSNTLSVEAMVKQGGRAKAPRRVCHGCVALRNEGEALKREVLRLRSGMKAMQARLEALETAAVRAATARAARRERARSATPPAGPPPAVVAASSPPKPPAAAPRPPAPGPPARDTPPARVPPRAATPPATPPPPPDSPPPPAWPAEADAWPPEPAVRVISAPGPETPTEPPPCYSPPRRGRTYSPQRAPARCSGVLDALHAILGCDRAALADEATRVPCEPLAIALRPAPPPAPPPTRAHRHRFCLTPEPTAGPPPPPPDPFARVVYEEPAELPDRDVVAV